MVLNNFDLSVAFLNLNEEILFNFFKKNQFIDFCSKIKTEPFGTVDVNVSFFLVSCGPRGKFSVIKMLVFLARITKTMAVQSRRSLFQNDRTSDSLIRLTKYSRGTRAASQFPSSAAARRCSAARAHAPNGKKRSALCSVRFVVGWTVTETGRRIIYISKPGRAAHLVN